MRKTLCLTLIALTLAACTHWEWQRPGSTQADLSRDNYACMQSAMAAAPPAYATTTSYKAPSMNGVWNSSAGIAGFNGGSTTTKTEDVNAKTRSALTNACLESRGWQQVEVSN
ncbi:MAG: hypothetical protein JO126_02815 [Alphaproteobacteria bacterium]|nr:hypothetical protein [Alphaproteobacteria bacterium]